VSYLSSFYSGRAAVFVHEMLQKELAAAETTPPMAGALLPPLAER
jgi:hypothetical protein